MRRFLPLTFILIGLVLVSLWVTHSTSAQGGSPLHPNIPLLDEDGQHVLVSGKPVSTMQTCGSCHDTEFIENHSFHADAGLSSFITGESGEGYFGRWDPITYRYLSTDGDEVIDLTTPEWLMTLGLRHTGGGPAVTGRNGELLSNLPPNSVETSRWNSDGELESWDWSKSGVVEMNCFLCHTDSPNNEARMAALQAGDFGWANSATLLGTGLIEQIDGEWQWNADSFDEEQFANIAIQDPTSDNCAQCHGVVHTDVQIPLTLEEGACETDGWTTLTTGQIISGQKISNSGLNLEDKDELTRSFDIHAERVLECVDCHYSLNNPVNYREDEESQPDHLVFDPRRMDIGDYLYRPIHDLASGKSGDFRSCESCHQAGETHEDWLPYEERHLDALECQTCHIPTVYGAALQTVDWTVINTDSTPQRECRGVDDDGLIKGYEPVLLQGNDSGYGLAPYNLVTAYYWIYGDENLPVPLHYLEEVWLDGEGYAADVLAVFDGDGDGSLDDGERVVDTQEKESLIAGKLEAAGLSNSRIAGQVVPYSINHTVTEMATKDCQTCHDDDSLIGQDFLLANYAPNGITPNTSALNGDIRITDDGKLYFEPEHDDLYVLGHNSVSYVDRFGVLAFLGTVFGVTAHSGLRYYTARKRAQHHDPRAHKTYMYTVYERQWHWLQTAVIFGLLFTGLIIHKPEMFGFLSFRYVVQIHNILAAILVINAGLALFYHVASGEIRQYLPQPRGFFYQSMAQASYYLSGIFRGKSYPFAKTPEKKLNPLQQLTYFAILNVLLPAQIITGALIWGAQTYPDLADSLGGLPFLGPLHSLMAWMFASFIVAHVYLTTTGHTPTAHIKAMITGWDDVELTEKRDETNA